MKIGDLVTRNSHNNDIVFTIIDIENNIYYLKGINVRLYADSEEDDLVSYDRKEDIKTGFYQTSYGTFGLVNAVAPTKYLVLSNDTKVLNDVYDGIKYAIKTESEVINIEYNTGVYRTLDNIRVRTGPGVNYPQKRVKALTADGKKNATSTNPDALAYYKKGTLFDAIEIFIMDDEVWAKTYSGFVNIIYKNEVNCEKV